MPASYLVGSGFRSWPESGFPAFFSSFPPQSLQASARIGCSDFHILFKLLYFNHPVTDILYLKLLMVLSELQIKEPACVSHTLSCFGNVGLVMKWKWFALSLII
jgi:hypothetical protein